MILHQEVEYRNRILGSLKMNKHQSRACSILIFLFWQLQSPFACRLNIGLVVATDAISNAHKIEIFLVKDIMMLACNFEKALRQPVVVLLLFGSVVHAGMFQVFVPIGN